MCEAASMPLYELVSEPDDLVSPALVVALDDRTQMAQLGAARVRSSKSAQQAKSAIDSLWKALTRPDYLLIVGGPDVIPHVPLVNHMPHVTSDDDPDARVPSDLPYACEAPYGLDPAAFVAADRVVGRIPDIPSATDPAYLIGLLRTAAHWQPAARSAYRAAFALSARAWRKSTEKSLRGVFGRSDGVRYSPNEGPNFADETLAPRMHFINCHGDRLEWRFFGQHDRDSEDYPTALESSGLAAVAPGTIVAAECCYGARIAPPLGRRRRLNIALTYLGEGAYGFFGSTTVAYGAEITNDDADLLCGYFLQEILAGASLGRAALQARLRFTKAAKHLDVYELKALAQFILLGDPSIHPVVQARQTPRARRMKAVALAVPNVPERSDRQARRRMLTKEARRIATTVDVPERVDLKPSANVERELYETLAAATRIPTALDSSRAKRRRPRNNVIRRRLRIRSYVARPVRALGRTARDPDDGRDSVRFHVASVNTLATRAGNGPIRAITAVVITVRDNRIVDKKVVHTK